MTPEQFEKLEAIVLAVEGLAPVDRDRYIDHHCQDDAELRDQVEAVLGARDSTVGFLETPVLAGGVDFGTGYTTVGDGAPDRGAFLVGTQFGKYAVGRMLGRGGMGVVYEAEEDHPRRTVALKVVHPHLVSAETTARLKSEAQILANLDHESIARIIEAGVHDGLPYFAMEHVPNARTILDYAQHRNLDLRARLTLFARVCRAVTHGHLKGIIHRDLKPGNILVDQDGTPKVIDFGVARVTNGDIPLTTQYTEVGQLVGTLQYMSPEQVRGDSKAIDTRSDVYSLGIILYELLCGKPPYVVSSASIARAARIVESHRPNRPSTINRLLRGDVETIVLKAIEKDPSLRYQSAGDFGDDVQRFLERRPIRARRTGPFKALYLFVMRHKVASAAAACAALGLLVVVLVTSSFYLNAQQERNARRAAKELLARVEDQLISRSHENVPFFLVEELDKTETRPARGTWVVFNPGAMAIEFQNDQGDVLQRIETLSPEVVPEWAPGVQGNRDPPDPLVPQRAMLADFLPNVPDRELAVSFGSGNLKLALLRIYDLDLNVLHDLWVYGGVRSIVWDERHRLLLFTAIAPFLDCVEPRLTGTASAGCPISKDFLEVAYALRPKDMDGTVSLLSFVDVPPARTEWVLAYPRVDGDVGQRDWAAWIAGVESPSPERTDAACTLLLQTANLGTVLTRQYQTFEFRVPVSPTGAPLGPFQPPSERHAHRTPSADDLVQVDLNALFRVAEQTVSIFRGSASLDEATQALAADSSLPANDRQVAERALLAMYDNWRWLNREAARSCSAPQDAMDDKQRLQTAAWATRAVTAHDLRCPAPDRCLARIYPLNTLGMAQYRAGRGHEALQAFRQSNVLLDRLYEMKWLDEKSHRDARAWNEVYSALASAAVGQMNDTRHHLQQAEADQPFVYFGTEFTGVLAEARAATHALSR